MYKKVPIRDRGSIRMCIGDADYFDSGLIAWWLERRTAKEEDDAVDEGDERS
jgi:hypothetical protein